MLMIINLTLVAIFLIQPLFVIKQASASPPTPARHKDVRWQNAAAAKQDEPIYAPVILNKPEEIVVGAGSNITLACSARGSAPLTFVWFQDEKNITGNTGSTSNQGEPPPTTKLLEERRYEIQEKSNAPNVTTSILFLMDLKLTDTSVFLCWVENAAGYTFGNFSLVVDDSPPNHLASINSRDGALSSLSNSLARLFGADPNQHDASNGLQFTIVLIVFLLLLLLTVICLYILKQATSGRSSKSSSQSKSDLKAASQQMTGAHVQTGDRKLPSSAQMFASSDEDDLTDDDDDRHSSLSDGASSSGSCTKNNNTCLMPAKELDGFFEHMRTGIIDIDHHSMSPAIQFNNNNNTNNTLKSQPKGNDQRQLTQLNHFQSSSNASSQQAFYGGQPSNGSNSMATTLSDLSPSSGSASTSFANPAQNHLQQQQHLHLHHQQQQQQIQQHMMANHHLMRHHPAVMGNNCDYAPREHASANFSGEYRGGYNDDSVAHQMIVTGGPPMYSAGPQLSSMG